MSEIPAALLSQQVSRRPEVAAVLRAGFDASPDPEMLIDPVANAVLRANREACRFFALTHDEIVSRPFAKLYAHALGELYVFTEEALGRGYAFTRELVFQRPDGAPMELEHQAIVCGSHAPLLLFRIIDLQHRQRRKIDNEATVYHRGGLEEWKKAERFFREIERENQMILSAAGEGIYGVNADGDTTFVNPAGAQMLGYEPDELVGKNMHVMVHHKHADGSHYRNEDCPIYNAFRDGKVNTVEDDFFWRKDGKPLRVAYTSTPIIDSGAVVGAVVVFSDIAERKKNEDELKRALDENARLRERLERENAYLQEEILIHSNHHEILGSSAPIAKIIQQIELVAPTDASVLVTGESGTGKELVARAIHQSSPRKDRPLIKVNCAAIPRELFESEFFGHIRGSFTGAVRDRVGRFELADGGTLFLDEVGEIPLDLQAKLLRVLQERKFERVGEEKTREVDVRLIAATNRDLKAEVAAGRFRQDLYFRLNVFPIETLPLRERSQDIPVLAEHFLTIICQRLNLPKPTFTRANIEDLQGYGWPGNARELQNVIERAAILSRNGRLTFNLPKSGAETAPRMDEQSMETQDTRILTAAELRQIEAENLRRALSRCHGRVSGRFGAAELLGMKATTLFSRLKALNISAQQ